jgi:hypothetical protein
MLYKLEKLEADGSVEIRAHRYNAELALDTTTIDCQTLVDDYQIVEGISAMSNFDYKCHNAIIEPAWMVTEYTSRVYMAMAVLARRIGVVNLVIREEPTKHVFACQSFDIGDCVLVPAGANVKALNKSTHQPSPADALYMCKGDLGTTHTFHANGVCMGKVVSPCFIMRSTCEEKAANMVMSMVDVSLSQKMDGARAVSYKLSLPVWKNRKAIAEGDELLYFKQKKDDITTKKKRPFNLI